VNPSWEIASSLPTYLPPLQPKDASARTRPSIPPVRIAVHPAPIRVSYRVVRALVPKLWDGSATGTHSAPDEPVKLLDFSDSGQGIAVASANAPGNPLSDTTKFPNTPSPTASEYRGKLNVRSPNRTENFTGKIDLCIHIGMAGPRQVYHIEHRGHRDGYILRDVDEELLGDDEVDPISGKPPRDTDDWPWRGLPAELTSWFDMPDVLRRWRELAPPGNALNVSEDAGRYLCDFIYFSSLAELEKRGRDRTVVFLLVPSAATAEAVNRGKVLVLALVRAIVESWVITRGGQC